MTNIHKHNPRRKLTSIQESSKISQENKEDLKDFYKAMKKSKKGKARMERYLVSAKKVFEYKENDFRLKEATELQIDKIAEQIDNSAYYHKEYSPETKKEYRKFLRLYMKWAEFNSVDKNTDVPEKVRSVKTSVSEDVKDRTAPSDLPSVDEIKLLCQNLSLRLRALYFTQWDLGSRINEVLRCRIEDYKKEDGKAYIYLRVNPEDSVEGSKSSRRRCRVKIAPPVIDRWIEEEHPNPEDEAYLFCRKNKIPGKNPKAHAYRPVNYPFFNRKIQEVSEELGIEADVRTHTVRKSRISFLKSVLKMPESDVDKRIGHIPGSEVTRDYTRLDDADSNNAYGEAYGEENPEDKEVEDLVPLTCKDCKTTNAGYRDRCYECQGLLGVKEFKQAKEQISEARELLWQTLEEKGITEEIEEAVKKG